MLVQAGMLSLQDVKKAQEAARRESIPLPRILVRDGLVVARDLAAFTALHMGLTMVDLRGENFDPETVGLIPEDVSRRYTVLALRRDDGRLHVAMSDPTDFRAIQDLTASTGFKIEPLVATDQELQENIDVAYRIVRKHHADLEREQGEADAERVTAGDIREAQPARIVNLLLLQAQTDGASDIHIEPTENLLRIRFRIDSILAETMSLPLELHPAVISRIKIMSAMNIAERRKAQDCTSSKQVGQKGSL